MNMHTSFYTLFIWGLVVLTPHLLLAQSSINLDDPKLPEETGLLPEPSTTLPAGIVLSTKNITQYRKLLPIEIIEFIRSGDFVLDSAKRLRYTWRMDDTFEAKSRENETKPPKLTVQGNLAERISITKGYPFGPPSAHIERFQKSISTEIVPPTEKHNSNTLGVELLWNLQSHWWSRSVLTHNIRMQWFRAPEEQPFRSINGEVARIYPATVLPADTTGQMFRERILFTAPAAINRYTWLTFRFFEKDEDLLWVFSPATAKVRQLTASNRTDGIFQAVAPDDFLGWSGKIDSYDVEVKGLAPLLTPFAALDIQNFTKTKENCLELTRANVGNTDLQNSWNYQTLRFDHVAAWVPSSAVFVPRYTWELELTNRDPYALYGRQLVYLDAASYLPVYRVVYDRAGRQWKTIISIFGLGASPDRQEKVPYPSVQIVVDHLAKLVYTLDYVTTQYCPQMTEMLKLTQFDPRKLG
jgi:hypothetical protein